MSRCAQRLSASLRWARDVTAGGNQRHVVCSTPFGITEVGTIEDRRSTCDDDSVLNAFRHHRGGHVIGPLPGPARNASAQRLSASQKWARSNLLRDRLRDRDVLNAFRHH